jgi:hypothetical protein
MTPTAYAVAASLIVLVSPFIGKAIRMIARNDGGR